MTKTIKPLIIITNDDGIESPGLLALVESVYHLGDIIVIAPKQQQTNMGRGSLSGQSIGVIEPRTLETQYGNVNGFAIEGSPAQAIAHGILELCPRQPDLCLSGVNYGENLGLAFTCSGTLGAVFEADSFGVPGIAFSRAIPIQDQRSSDFEVLAWEEIESYCLEIVQKVLAYGLPKNVKMLNVNFPPRVEANLEKRMTEQANMCYGSYIKPKRKNLATPTKLQWKVNESYHLAGARTDIHAIHCDGVISITPLTSKMSIESLSYYGNV